MEFANKKADPAATDPNSQNTSELETGYRDLALRMAVFPGDPRNNNPQLYFDKLPPELPAEFPLPSNTRLLGSLVRSAQHLDLYLDTTLTADQVIEFYTEKLTAAGWEKLDSSSIPGQWAGFMPGNRRMNNTLFCQGSQGPSLTLQTNLDGSGDVRINVNLDTTNNPCDQSRRHRMMARPMESLIPSLLPPPGDTQDFNGGGGGGGNSNGWYSSATLDTDLDLAALATHYNTQVDKAGWHVSGQGVAGQVAWSQWTLNDKEGQDWQGLLLIYKDLGNARHHFLHVKVERSQPGPTSSQQPAVKLRF
jgi:hypothetical protein